jgi:TolB-like protein/Tfp pilus assembly protein PilF
MKRCPECRRDYFDDSLLYCLDDGAALLEGPATGDHEAVTVPNRTPETAGLRPVVGLRADYPTEVLPPSFPGTFGAVNSIAVLPFANLSKDSDIEYFSDGLAEELSNVLSKIRGFRVAARTSAFSFKNSPSTVPEIGAKLNVASVVEGSVRMVGERMRVAVQLVNVADGFQVWSDSYDRELDDIFAVQDDIAESVVEELRIQLLGEERREEISERVTAEVARANRGRADDPEAQLLLMQGRYFLDRTTRDDTSKAIEYFRQALATDPEFALCWAELARAYTIEAGRAWVPVDEGFEKARIAVDKALEFEPELAEGHATRERIQETYDWDLDGADVSIQRALELAPGNASVLDRAAILAYKLVNFDEALGLARRAVAQDPLSAAIWHNVGLIAHAAGQLDEAENAFRKALELIPQRFLSGALLSLVLMDQGRMDEAVEQAAHEPEEFWRLWSLAIVEFAAGRNEDADQRLSKLLSEHVAGSAFQIAEVYAVRGEKDAAFEWLYLALKERDSGVTHAAADPQLRALHGDERWLPLLEKIGFDRSER